METTPPVGKKKRGRKTIADYVSIAQKELEKMRQAFDIEKKRMNPKERMKHRNRISALEYRIKARKN